MLSTAGLPFLLRPAIAAAVSANGAPRCAIVEAARFALIERLRRVDEPVLDTLLVSSLSPDLGPDDVAAALRLRADEAQRLVTAPAQAVSSSRRTARRFCDLSIAPSPQIIGAARHHEIELALLCSQIEL